MAYTGQPPLKRVRDDAVVNPCSGCYEGGDRNTDVQLIIDIDRTAKFTKSLGMISGTVSGKGSKHVQAPMFFKVIPMTMEVTGGQSNERRVSADIKVAFSNGVKNGGTFNARLYLNPTSNVWSADVEIEIRGKQKVAFKNVKRTSKFFKEVKLDIDFTDKLIWPTVVLDNLRDTPRAIRDRKIDPFSAFEDAGLKLIFDENDSEKVEDPTPEDPWTKGDLYEVMMNFFDESEDSDENIWCMLGTIPPDKRFMGFSFDRKGRHGFGLFTKHRTFDGLESSCPKKKAGAHRQLLHYLVHECGHCLGLKHPFEIGAPESLSWMNYAHRYDVGKEPGSFYQNFTYSFSDQELMVLRHSPTKAFRASCSSEFLSSIMGSGYSVKSEAPDAKLADDDDDIDPESSYQKQGYGMKTTEMTKPRPNRKIGLDLRVPQRYRKGQLLSFEARLKNIGKLPALVEGDLSIESGNLQLYLTKPDGTTKAVDPFVRPIYSGYSKPKVLYTPEDEEGPDRYSETVVVGEGSEGYQVDMPGTYKVRAVYSGGRYNVTSETCTITVEEDDDDDAETQDEILTAATLQASSYDRFQKSLKFWKNLEKQPVEKKKSKVATLVAFFDGMSRQNSRKTGPPAKKRKRGGRRQIGMEKGGPPVSRARLIKDTNDLVQYYQNQGVKEDNMEYSNLVMARGKLYLAEKNTKDADSEFNRMLNDLLSRGVKYDILSKLTKKWNKLKNPPKTEEKYTSASLQSRVNKVLTWAPSNEASDEDDISGVGLGNPFSNFDIDQIKKSTKIIEMLFTKFDETQDLIATINFANKLQQGREVNYMVLRWALEAFIVHSMDAKKAGIRYPEPEDRDETIFSNAAMMVTKREGLPQEQWMNYWRCDADFNYHHRHWHIVYIVGQFLNRDGSFTGAPPHLLRQGELFGYMHSQMLARYDAERESWGLEPVQPWDLTDTSMPFNAGFEFHSDRQFSFYAPRPSQTWPSRQVQRFKGWEMVYNRALETGFVEHPGDIEMTPDRAGHILEPSSQVYPRHGSYHNSGHGVFGSINIPGRRTSYMNDTATAVRDLIFYRWHRRIDSLWLKNNNYYRSELAHDSPPVTITADDIMLSSSAKPPSDFTKWTYGSWAGKAPEQVTRLCTYLGPAKKKYEWDNKLSHEKFYYHLRIKRNAEAGYNGDLPLTLRIFICPKRVQHDRRRWIEMDKFVCKIPSGEDHIALTRADVHSSVIKRLHEHMESGKEPDEEKKLVEESPGFCECGWPYNMLLPRGKKAGEEYVLFVMATDNKIDSIGIRTSCGSMSYCGARGQAYPDSRNMGYPFSNPISYNGQFVEVPAGFDKISNAAYKTFVIMNDVAEPPTLPAHDVWFAYEQLRVNDGTLRNEPRGGISEFVQSELVGTFRVLVDNEFCKPSRPGKKLYLRFQGRGPGGGSYVISDVHFSLREGNTLQISKQQNSSAKVSCQGQTKFTVPECGVLSDVVNMTLDPGMGDYFVTFTVESPGVYLPASQNTKTSTYYLPASVPTPDIAKDWSDFPNDLARFGYVQCLCAVMAES